MSRSSRLYPVVIAAFLAVAVSCNPMSLVPMPKAETKALLQKDLRVPMRDGVELAAYLYHPPGDGPWPVILNRLPYGRKSVEPTIEYLAGSGYAVLVQDTRGRYNSGGGSDKFYPFFSEEQDGRDTMKWISEQSWCNGKIATWGGSYHGITQWALAADNPLLDAMAPLITSANCYTVHYRNGVLNYETTLGWGVKNMGRKSNNLASPPRKAFFHLPLIDADDVAKTDWPYWDEMLKHPTEDDFWAPLNFRKRLDEVNAPALFVSGWYDIFNMDQLRDFAAWEKRGPDAPDARIIVGPWNHLFYNTNLDNVDWGWKEARSEVLMACKQWFDTWLTRKRNNIPDHKPVRIYIMGEGWREFDQWPPEGVSEVSFYLRGDGNANTSKGDGVLSMDAPQGDEPADDFVYDPHDPVPSVGGQSLIPWNAGPADQGRIEERDDVLVYTTDTIGRITIVGSVRVKLYAMTSAVDTDFTAKLVDVYPDGKAIIVNDGILRGRYLEGPTEKILVPGKVYEWDIDLGYTALRVNEGHRLRVEISSSNFPRYDRNLNTGAPLATGDSIEVARQRVLHSSEYPSRLVVQTLE